MSPPDARTDHTSPDGRGRLAGVPAGGTGVPARLAEFVGRAFATTPTYAASAADRRTVTIAGLELPVRATAVLLVAVTALCLDWSRTFIPREILDLGRAAPAIRFQAAERLVLFGLVPLLVVVVAFRERPGRYGLGLGDWRIGLPLAALGSAAMTPVILWLAGRPEFVDYYRPSAGSPADVLVTNLLDLPATEFLLRGFLMFTLVRSIGPLGVVVAVVPFVFSHLGKPEVELLSTFFGGLVYGWLDWRTGSIWWSAAAHVFLVTLLVVAVGGGGTAASLR